MTIAFKQVCPKHAYVIKWLFNVLSGNNNIFSGSCQDDMRVPTCPSPVTLKAYAWPNYGKISKPRNWHQYNM